MADISKEIQAIEKAVYGEEVRGSIRDAILKINTVAENSDLKADDAVAQVGQARKEITEALKIVDSTLQQATQAVNTAKAKAEEASTSASTATSAAQIATAKAEEASTSASTASNAAQTATAKAEEASTSASTASNAAQTATAKAEEASTSASIATGAAQTATAKAEEASTSASTASNAEKTATAKAEEARRWAIGVETIEGSMMDNSKYYSEQAKAEYERARQEADRASKYSNIIVPTFHVDWSTMELIQENTGKGVEFELINGELMFDFVEQGGMNDAN